MSLIRPANILPVCLCFHGLAADLQPDKANEIPASAKCPTVIQLDQNAAAQSLKANPKVELPPGFTLTIAAVPPLVTHPIAGCLESRGRLFLCDAVGVNWNKAHNWRPSHRIACS
jgi:hypothetical protein